MRLALPVLGFALACGAAAALVGPPSDRPGSSDLAFALAGLGFFTGLGAFGAACVARAYWAKGDGDVSGAKRFALGLVAPAALMVVILGVALVAWFFVPHGRLWLWIVGPPILLAAERLSAPLLTPKR
jgi:hypothetical protein